MTFWQEKTPEQKQEFCFNGVYGYWDYDVHTELVDGKLETTGISKVFRDAAIQTWVDVAIVDTVGLIGIGEDGIAWI